MRIIRLLLQLILVIGFTAIFFIWLFAPTQDYVFIFSITGFFSFLLFLTFLLREHTESRIHADRKVNPKIIGAFLALAGIGMLWKAWSIVFHPLSESSYRLQILNLISDNLGPFSLALLFFSVGVFTLLKGWRTVRAS